MQIVAPHPVWSVLLALLPGGLLTAWCLFAVDWRKTWPVLARGGWVVLVLLALVLGGTWGLIERKRGPVFGVPAPAFQILCSFALVCVVLFAGWLQGLMNWKPVEVALGPAHDHHHGDDHGQHDSGHSSHEDSAHVAGPDEPAASGHH